MGRRLLHILGMVGLLLTGFLLVARIRIEPLPVGIHHLFNMTDEDAGNTRLAQARDECIDAMWDLRNQRNRAELITIVGMAAFSITTLMIARRLPKFTSSDGTPDDSRRS